MHYTRRVGEYEETFEGTPEEISEVMKVIDSKELHEAVVNIKPAPCIIINAYGADVDAEKVGKIAVEAIEKQLKENDSESKNVFLGLESALT